MKDIKDFEGEYAVTSCGKVWSYKTGKFLSPIDNHGYKMVILSSDGEIKAKYIHRLVAEAYIPNPDNLPEVDHINNCRGDNRVNNLQWLTREDNMKKSTNARKVYCVELDKVFESQTQAAKELGLEQTNISKVCRGKLKTTGGYHWTFITED